MDTTITVQFYIIRSHVIFTKAYKNSENDVSSIETLHNQNLYVIGLDYKQSIKISWLSINRRNLIRLFSLTYDDGIILPAY